MPISGNNKRSFGNEGEKIAREYLSRNNFHIRATNYRVGKMGEIDIIAQESEYICFIEVKTRTSTIFGLPSEAVNRRKQENIIRLAQVYINQYGLKDKNIRFDIVEVIINKDKEPNINIIKNAF